MKKFQSLLLGLAFLSTATYAQVYDLKVEVNQSTFDKVLNSMKFPFTLLEHNDPFNGLRESTETDVILDDDLTTQAIANAKSIEYFKWAVEGNKKSIQEIKASTNIEIDNAFKDELLTTWENTLKEIQAIVEGNEGMKAKGEHRQMEVTDFTMDELKKVQGMSVEEAINFFNTKEKGAFNLKAHLAYMRVDLNEKPSLKVNSPTFKVGNIRIETTVTGELWAKVPEFHCCRTWLGICVCIRTTWNWKRIGSITISPIIGADGQIAFDTPGLKVVGKGKFDKLFLDYPILREINLAPIANYYLARKEFELYDAAKFVASLPYINSRFVIESLTLPVNPNGVSIEVIVKE